MSDELPNKKHEEVDSEASDHSYKDYSNVPIQQGVIVDNSASAIYRKRAALFPTKLHEIVSNPEYEHIISWNAHGRSWEVKDKKLLVSIVAKEHFNHSNYESFNRLVNLWGFKVRLCDETMQCFARHNQANRPLACAPLARRTFHIY
jgi:hypothetical protein